MIKVLIKKSNNVVLNIKCTGHAKYSEFGKDIVCASFSTLVITTINSIIKFDKNAISYKNDNSLEITNVKKDDITNKLLDNLIEMMKELESDYAKNINIKEESHE